MKKILAFIVTLTLATTLSAQSLVRTGFYMENGNPVISNPQNSVTVSITVEKRSFIPGQFARYAQKMLGVRASLAERTETSIVAAELSEQIPSGELVKVEPQTVEGIELPPFRFDNRAMSAEQQAQAAADMIFSLRRQRKELISGDAGENVFGAGLKAALEYIEKTEKQCLDMFYGTNVRSVEQYRYTITPTASEKNYIVCRYREGVGILPLSDFSGDPIMVIITPTDGDTSSLPFATEKDKVRTEFLVAATCDIELLCGTDSLATLQMEMFQYGKKVVLSVK
ncbi:MAG: DUF4831 family protein [Alistipes sp.]|nr:DUF4831 family protein [Alistipes sp.]